MIFNGLIFLILSDTNTNTNIKAGYPAGAKQTSYCNGRAEKHILSVG